MCKENCHTAALHKYTTFIENFLTALPNCNTNYRKQILATRKITNQMHQCYSFTVSQPNSFLLKWSTLKHHSKSSSFSEHGTGIPL